MVPRHNFVDFGIDVKHYVFYRMVPKKLWNHYYFIIITP